jgi:hypothetical protein
VAPRLPAPVGVAAELRAVRFSRRSIAKCSLPLRTGEARCGARTADVIAARVKRWASSCDLRTFQALRQQCQCNR